MTTFRLPRPRTTTIAALGVALSLVLAACGSSDADGTANDDADTSALLPPAEGTTTYPLTLDTAWGEVTIEKRPERMIATDTSDFGLLVALGVTPVGSHDDENTFVPWSKDVLVEGVEPVTWPWGDAVVPPESVAKADTDLVVATSWGQEPLDNLDQISGVAPVLAQPKTEGEPANWRDQLLLLGEALDLPDRAQGLVDDYETSFEAFRKDHPELDGKTVAFVQYWADDDINIGNPAGSAAESLFSDMGLAPNPDGERFSGDNTLSPELLSTIEADVVIAFDYAETREEFAAWIDSPLFQKIDAVQDGRLIQLASDDRITWTKDGDAIAEIGHPGMAYNDPIGTPRLAHALGPLLSEALTK